MSKPCGFFKIQDGRRITKKKPYFVIIQPRASNLVSISMFLVTRNLCIWFILWLDVVYILN